MNSKISFLEILWRKKNENMKPRRTESMRDVLLRANTISSSPSNSINANTAKKPQSVSALSSGLNFAGVTWKSVKTANYDVEILQKERGQYFPAKLALALGMAKVLMGLLFIAFGVLAIFEKATYSQLGSGKKKLIEFVLCYRQDVYVMDQIVN